MAIVRKNFATVQSKTSSSFLEVIGFSWAVQPGDTIVAFVAHDDIVCNGITALNSGTSNWVSEGIDIQQVNAGSCRATICRARISSSWIGNLSEVGVQFVANCTAKAMVVCWYSGMAAGAGALRDTAGVNVTAPTVANSGYVLDWITGDMLVGCNALEATYVAGNWGTFGGSGGNAPSNIGTNGTTGSGSTSNMGVCAGDMVATTTSDGGGLLQLAANGSGKTSQAYAVYIPAPTGPQTFYGATSSAYTFGRVVSGTRQTFSSLDRVFSFQAVTAGKVIVTQYGSLIMPIAFNAVINGRRKTISQVTFPIAFSKDISGQRKTFSKVVLPISVPVTTAGIRVPFTRYGTIDFPISFNAVLQGRRKTLGQLVLPVTFSKDVNGQRKTFGQLQSPLLFSKDVRASRKTFGQTVFPITASIAVAGIRLGNVVYSSVAFPLSFTKDVNGRRKTFGQVAMPSTFFKDVKGQRKTFGQTTLPIIFTKEAVGRKQVFGQLLMGTLFGKEVAGRRRTFSQTAFPLVFTKDVSGRKKTFGQVALPINAVFLVDGVARGNKYGQMAMSIVFDKQTAARRKTFGQVTAPFILGESVQGERRAFSNFVWTLNFDSVSKSGPVGIHGRVALPIIVGFETAGRVMPVGVILNLAKMVYLGIQDVRKVYVGDEKVWPSWTPNSIEGLVVWFDASQLPSGPLSNPLIDLSDANHNGSIVGSPSPTVLPDILNGLSVVRFKLNEGRIRGDTGLGAYGTVSSFNTTIIYVTRMVGPSVGRAFTAVYPNNNYLVGFHTYGYDWMYDNGNVNAYTPWGALPTPWKLYGADGYHTGSAYTSRFFIDTVLAGSVGSGNGFGPRYALSGYDENLTQETCDFEMAEFVVYNHRLSDNDRQTVEAYLKEKWGLP